MMAALMDSDPIAAFVVTMAGFVGAVLWVAFVTRND